MALKMKMVMGYYNRRVNFAKEGVKRREEDDKGI